MAIALTGDFSVAEDIVQETFITVTEKAGSFTLGTNFSAWLGTIVRYKLLQKHRPWPRLSSEVIESLTAGVTPEAEDDRLSALLTCLGEAAGTGGRGVSAGVSQLWWRYPADCRRPAAPGRDSRSARRNRLYRNRDSRSCQVKIWLSVQHAGSQGSWCQRRWHLQLLEKRLGDRKPTGKLVDPSLLRSARTSPITGANLKPWPENPVAMLTCG